MKKRIITLLAVLTLLVVCVAFSAQAANTPKTHFTSANWTCPSCGKTGDQLTFTTWGTSGNLGGTYALKANSTAGECNHYFLGAASSSGSTRTISGTGRVVIVVTNDSGSAITHATRASLNKAFMNVAANQEVYIVGNNATIRGSMADATAGGVFYVASGGSLHLSGNLKVKGVEGATGMPTTGGIIYSKGTVTMNGITVDATLERDALTASGNGGTITNQGTMTITGCTIVGGKVDTEDALGGAIYNDGTLTITNSTVRGGSAYRGATLANNSGTVTISGGTITGGVAANRGGIYFAGSGVLNITDSAVLNANADMDADYRGVSVHGGKIYFTSGTINSANKGIGDGIALGGGELYLDGNATVKNADGTPDNNIWRWKTESATAAELSPAKIYIANTWTGTASMNLEGVSLTNHGSAVLSTYVKYGSLSGTTFTDGDSKTATKIKMYLEYPSHDNPQLAGYTNMLSTCRYVLMDDGKVDSWHVTPSTAITQYTKISGEKYIKVWGNYTSGETNVNTTVYMDLNGRNVTKLKLGANGKIYAFDSTAAAGEVGASINVAAQPITQFGGRTYVYNGGKIYPVEFKISQVALRPTNVMASMYYIASFNAHADAGVTGGVALTVNPDASKTEMDDTYMYTPAQAITGLVEEANSVLVEGIVQSTDSADTVKANAAMPIYAKAYIQVGDAIAFVEANTNHSLSSLIAAVELAAPNHAIVKAMAEYDWYKALKA